MEILERKIEKDGIILNSLEVKLPKTTLLILEGYGGFAMCGALDVGIYNSLKMIERKVICMKSVGVKTIEELYNSQIKEVSVAGNEKGIYSGMTVYDAFIKLSKKE